MLAWLHTTYSYRAITICTDIEACLVAHNIAAGKKDRRFENKRAKVRGARCRRRRVPVFRRTKPRDGPALLLMGAGAALQMSALHPAYARQRHPLPARMCVHLSIRLSIHPSTIHVWSMCSLMPGSVHKSKHMCTPVFVLPYTHVNHRSTCMSARMSVHTKTRTRDPG